MSAEFRKHPRVRPSPAAPIRIDIMGNGFLEVVQARDISVGGLSVFVPHGFAGCDLATQVDLIVTLGRSRPFKAKAVIVHRSLGKGPLFFGVQFTQIEGAHRMAIETYVAARIGRLQPGLDR